MKSISELRQDLVSGDWVVVATGRSKRPNDFLAHKRQSFYQPKKTCPFETLDEKALLAYASGASAKGGEWWVQVMPNKYPAFRRGVGRCAVFISQGPYQETEGIGFHELVVTRDHARSLALMNDEEAELVLRAYQQRYKELERDACVEYISIFHNHGRLAGATIAHPHSQIMAIPVVPPDVWKSLQGAEKFFAKERRCVHCVMIAYEAKTRERVIYEDSHFIAITPFASRAAFEIRLFPKKHGAHFNEISPDERKALAHAFRMALAKLFYGLDNPDHNFFIHTAPTKNYEEHSHYHWHIEIVPKTAIWAGFEIGTGIEISTIKPESAAEFLRKVRVL